MSPGPLTVHNAEITTAAVEVKTLTIKSKQVTLAVFRQLREEPLISESGALNGVPWGIVNYHPDKCGDHAGHWHVVWQRGSDLLRSYVSHESPSGSWSCQEGNKFLTLCHRDSLNGGTLYFKGNPPRTDRYGAWLHKEAPFTVGMWHGAEVADAYAAVDSMERQRESLDRVPEEQRSNWAQEALSAAVDKAKAAIAELDRHCQTLGGTTDEWFDAYQAKLAAEVARRNRHRQVRSAIADLPQLFIAV